MEPELFSDEDEAPSECHQLHVYSSEAPLSVNTNSDGPTLIPTFTLVFIIPREREMVSSSSIISAARN